MELAPPRIELGTFPTPVHELHNFSKAVGGPRFFIKRDDLTGLALGGNKVRKLEYILADPDAQQADVILTVGAIGSNHARQTAAAARVLGKQCHLVLFGRPPAEPRGNYLLDLVLGAEITCVPSKEIDQCVTRIIEKYQKEGKTCFYIPAGGHTAAGAFAYHVAFQELMDQDKWGFNTVVTAVGTGTTLAGLLLGHAGQMNGPVPLGVSVGGDYDWCVNELDKVLMACNSRFGFDIPTIEPSMLSDAYIGPGYARPYPEVFQAINLLARTEGIFLDPIYTGKAMAGLLDLIRQGVISKSQNVVFLHTGGIPELLAYTPVNINSG